MYLKVNYKGTSHAVILCSRTQYKYTNHLPDKHRAFQSEPVVFPVVQTTNKHPILK